MDYIRDSVKSLSPYTAALMGDAEVALKRMGIDGHATNLALVVDLSRNNLPSYGNGMLQLLVELLYATAVSMDLDAHVPVYGWENYPEILGMMTPKNADTFFLENVPEPNGPETGIDSLIHWVLNDFATPERLAKSTSWMLLVLTNGGSSEPLNDSTIEAISVLGERRIFIQFVGHSSIGSSFAQAVAADEMATHIDFLMWPQAVVDSSELLRAVLSDYKKWLESN